MAKVKFKNGDIVKYDDTKDPESNSDISESFTLEIIGKDHNLYYFKVLKVYDRNENMCCYQYTEAMPIAELDKLGMLDKEYLKKQKLDKEVEEWLK